MTKETSVDDLLDLLTIKLIMTPRTRMETCRDEEKAIEVIERMRAYDVLPVISSGRIQFFVRKTRIEKKIKTDGSAKVQEIKEEILHEHMISEDEKIDSFLSSEQDFFFVIKQEKVSGIVTYADLNKWPSKTFFYIVISRFEQLLIEAIENMNLSQRELEKYIGFWGVWGALGRHEQEKRGNVHLSLVQCLNTSDLVNIACKNTRIREILGYKTKNQAEKHLNPIVNLRNRIMHAGHSLIESKDDVKKRKEQCDTIRRHISGLLLWLKEN